MYIDVFRYTFINVESYAHIFPKGIFFKKRKKRKS